MSKLLITIAAALFISACTPEPKQPYECFNLDKQESEWTCTYKGKQLTPEEQESFNLNIKNGKGRAAE